MTTTGRKTGEPRRIEIAYHTIDGRIYITGMPCRSDAPMAPGLEEEPHLTFHLKGAVKADLPARPGSSQTSPTASRLRVHGDRLEGTGRRDDEPLQPLIEVTFDDLAA